MYAEVIFVQHLGVNEVDDVDLPHPVPDDSGHNKTSFSELEVSFATTVLLNFYNVALG